MSNKNMIKIQKALSVVPVISTIFIVIYTAINIKRKKDTFKNWLIFYCIFFGFGLVSFFVNTTLMTGENPILNFIVSWLILILANLSFIHLQEVEDAKPTEETFEIIDSNKKSRNKRILLIIFAVILPVFIAIGIFVGVLLNMGIKEHNKNTIEDTNGENDISLNVITQEDVLNDKYPATKMWFGESCEGEQTNVDNNVMKEKDYDKISFSAKSFSGVDLLQATKIESDSMSLYISSEVKSGNFAIMVFIDGECCAEIEGNTTREVRLTKISGNTVLVKIAGESAEMRVSVERKIGDFDTTQESVMSAALN